MSWVALGPRDSMVPEIVIAGPPGAKVEFAMMYSDEYGVYMELPNVINGSELVAMVDVFGRGGVFSDSVWLASDTAVLER